MVKNAKVVVTDSIRFCQVALTLTLTLFLVGIMTIGCMTFIFRQFSDVDQICLYSISPRGLIHNCECFRSFSDFILNCLRLLEFDIQTFDVEKLHKVSIIVAQSGHYTLQLSCYISQNTCYMLLFVTYHWYPTVVV